MLICLPGMASSVKRAATSEMRSAPLVMTMNWMTMMIRKMISPTTTCPPTTNCPNASMIRPAKAFSRINRVEATFSARRKSVPMSSSEGNVESSSGVFTLSTTMSNSSM